MNLRVDALLAVVAMLTALRPLLRGALGSDGGLSWRRALVLAGGGLASLMAVVGLAALEHHFLGRAFWLPTWLGGSLAWFGGMLGTSTLLSPRGPKGLDESGALRVATQSLSMTFYIVEPLVSLGFLGATRLLRACLPWTIVRRRWLGIAEGLVLLALCLLPRDETLGGLRREVARDTPAADPTTTSER